MNTLDALDNAYRQSSDSSRPFDHLVRRSRELLHGIEVRGGDLLDVGAGKGFLSHYLATVCCANHVVSLDEYEGNGSHEENFDINREMGTLLGNQDKVAVVKRNFNDYRAEQAHTHIFFVNVLHHIVVATDSDPVGKAARVLEKARGMLKNGGQIVIQESAPVNICPIPKYREQMSNVNFQDKLDSRKWISALEAAGYKSIKLRYRLPINLPWNSFLRLCCNNYLASILTDSSYIITAYA